MTVGGWSPKVSMWCNMEGYRSDNPVKGNNWFATPIIQPLRSKMKKISLLLLITGALFHSELRAQAIFSAIVIKIIDGDSIVVTRGNKNIEVRLYGIDTPEWNQPFSSEAKSRTASLIYKQKVAVAPQYYDSYGRLVALLFLNGQDVNGALVKSGTAWVYPRYCRKNVCRKWLTEQQIAKEERRGLWEIESPVSPWRWKRMSH